MTISSLAKFVAGVNRMVVENMEIEDHDGLAQIVAENINALCRLKDKKEKPKMTIAELCHVSPSAVPKWTKIPILPPVDALLIIADYFGVDLMYLLHQHDTY